MGGKERIEIQNVGLGRQQTAVLHITNKLSHTRFARALK